jgi:hypothetical protein
MLRLESSNVRDGSKDISAVGSGSFDTVSIRQLSLRNENEWLMGADVPVVDTPLSSFMINIKVLQVVVEINTSSTQVST